MSIYKIAFIMEIESLVDAFVHKTTVVWKPKMNFVRDIDVIINELKCYQSYINLDIYEVLVTCGHDLTWDIDYLVSQEDLNWFKNEEGKKYFLTKLNENVNGLPNINTIDDYRSLIDIHFKLCELFELQLESN